jgi:hypothetical protein
VNGIGFSSSSNTAGTRVIEITVNDGDDDSTIGTVKITTMREWIESVGVGGGEGMKLADDFRLINTVDMVGRFGAVAVAVSTE